ncbi:dioxygenase family protein [Bradyrhizobium sp. USDA 4486]
MDGAAIEWLTRTGKQSNDKRQEFILASDVVGVSMLVDCINHRLAGEATPTTVTGPFHVHGSPDLPDGADLAKDAPGELCYISGSVRNLDGEPIVGAILDIWQADGEGLYDAQRGALEPWMRGVFKSVEGGRFAVQTVLPVPYPIPMDGSVGEIMRQTNISAMRPAHIHFCIEAEGYRRLVTHVFRKSCPYVETDVVFGVKAPLIAEFKSMPAGTKTPIGKIADRPFWLLEYDFILQPAAEYAELKR